LHTFFTQAHHKGVLIRRVEPTAPAHAAVGAYDILLSFDGIDISNDGTVPFRSGERISFSYLVSQVGDWFDEPFVLFVCVIMQCQGQHISFYLPGVAAVILNFRHMYCCLCHLPVYCCSTDVHHGGGGAAAAQRCIIDD
jgi:hypothetical protein